MILSVLAYIADAAILGTYAWLSRKGPSRPFHIANALGAIPLLAVEVTAHAWPVLPVTASFGLVGWYGWLSS